MMSWSIYIPFYSFGLIWPKMVHIYRPIRHWRSTLYYVQHQSIRQPDLIAVHTSHTYQIHSNTAEYITYLIGPDFPGFPLFLFFIITQFKCIQNLCRIMFESIFCHTIMLIPFFLTTFRSERLLTKRAGPRFLSINKVQVFWEGYKSSCYFQLKFDIYC